MINSSTSSFHYSCNFSPIRLPEIKKIIYKCNQVLILSDGCVYRGKCNQLALPAGSQDKPKHNMDILQNNDQNRTEISREHYVRIDLHRLPNIDRAVNIVCDESFSIYDYDYVCVIYETILTYICRPHREICS